MAPIPHLSVSISSLFLLLLTACTNGFSEEKNLLHSEILKDEAVARLFELGKVSDSKDFLERTFQSAASVRAGNLIRRWMEDAGLQTWVDQMGNVHGRHEGLNPREKALLIGSHLDTVIDAGMFDGALGIITALSALKVLKIRGMLGSLKRPVEVIAFSDEEGVRFQSTFLGSAVIAGVLPVSTLHVHDKSGVTVQGALRRNAIDISEDNLLQLKYDPESVYGYVEVHIEQGPVLENVGLPLGLVKGIAGQTRLKVTVKGTQGHAGTVPMKMRRDPMSGAAGLIVLLESLCNEPESYLSYDSQCAASTAQSLAGSLVCTVGEISTWPSASNVIPGQVTFTVDIRAMDDLGREAVIYEFSSRIHQICDKRSLLCLIERKHDADAVACDAELSSMLKSAAYAAVRPLGGDEPDNLPVLMSGAGHDAMAMSHLTKVAMLFVRCRGGVSHSPAEHVLDDDVWAAGMALLAFLESLV
ncbi:allantoate deiminase 2-like [Salvia splendens]|uniref:allantoate deiminase 2-like n=1 Tax=Salvia splendens TaxID=180675 RepID=UPI001C251BE0|nr:allantoate deiminase 2-like [Salvia splendens]